VRGESGRTCGQDGIAGWRALGAGRGTRATGAQVLTRWLRHRQRAEVPGHVLHLSHAVTTTRSVWVLFARCCAVRGVVIRARISGRAIRVRAEGVVVVE
jgi:hypothetical protein